MFKDAHTNPVFKRLIPHPTQRPIQITMVLSAFILGAMLVAVIRVFSSRLIPYYGYAPIAHYWFGWLLALIVGLMALFGPVWAGIITVIGSGQAVRSNAYQLLVMTTLSGQQIARGHLLAALYRTRLLCGVFAALIPPLLLSMIYQEAIQRCVYFAPCQWSSTLDDAAYWTAAGFAVVSFAIGFFTLMVNTALVAILTTRRIGSAIAWTVIVAFCVYLLIASGVGIIRFAQWELWYRQPESRFFDIALISAFGGALFAQGRSFYNSAARAVRSTHTKAQRFAPD